MANGTGSNKDIVDVDQVREYVKEHSQDVYEYTYENGRRYASTKLGHYFIPNDEPEIQRSNQQHWIFTVQKGGRLHSAPINTSTPRILDIGCGSGIWAIQMAEEYPGGSIVGMDVSPIQPKNKPDNVEWVLGDVEKEWPFEKESFDSIHLSSVHGCVADWGGMMTKIKSYIKPGGYIEQQELALGTSYSKDGTVQPSDVQPEWCRYMKEAGSKRGRPVDLGPQIKGFLQNAPFADIGEEVFPMPVGTWPTDEKQKMIATHFMMQTSGGIEGYSMMVFTKVSGWSVEKTKEYSERVKEYCKDDSKHKYMDSHVAWGRKEA